MRIGRGRAPLEERDLLPDPIDQFRRWLAEEAAHGEADRMALATANAAGVPSARMVLLRGIGPRGFEFFTNYRSRKAREIESNPRVSLLFHWPETVRQVRIEGSAERLSAAESDAYFARRPMGSRLSAIASPQSEPVASREELCERMRELARSLRRERAPIRRPDHWGGYRVVPTAIEFWQGGPNRLHDRLRYVRTDAAGWRVERLAP